MSEFVYKFKVGDVVCLNSGGPKMTVSYVNGSTVRCIYWLASKQETSSYHQDLLTKVRPLIA